MTYSQNDEESVILDYFKDRAPARFLDIGAHDGVTFSNTRALADRGWTGTLVEPSPKAFVSLMNAYAGKTGCDLAHVAVMPSGRAGILTFADSLGDFVSTFDSSHRDSWSGRPGHIGDARVSFQDIFVAAIDFETLVARFPGPYAFVSLDVEGINFDLFRELPFRRMRVEMACVEYQDRLHDIDAHAASIGYRKVHVTHENAIFVADFE